MFSAKQALELTHISVEELKALQEQKKTDDERIGAALAFKELKEIEIKIMKYAKLGESDLQHKIFNNTLHSYTPSIIREVVHQLTQSGFDVSETVIYDGTILFISWRDNENA